MRHDAITVLLVAGAGAPRAELETIAAGAEGLGLAVRTVAAEAPAAADALAGGHDACLVYGEGGNGGIPLVREAARLTSGPVILVTRDGGDELLAQAVEAGAEDCVAWAEGGAEGVAHAVRRAVLRANSRESCLAGKMEALSSLISGIGHEINNPNHLVMMNAGVLEGAWRDARRVLDLYGEEHGGFEIGGIDYSEMREEIPALCRGIARGSQRISEVVGALRDFVREEDDEPKGPFDLDASVRAAVILSANLVAKAGVRFSAAYGQGLPRAEGSRQQLTLVALNLIRNACAGGPGLDRAVRVETRAGEDGATMTLTVEREGSGAAGEDAAALGRTANAMSGLAVASRIVREHGGTLRFVSSPGSGVRAVAVLPAGGQTGGGLPGGAGVLTGHLALGGNEGALTE